MTSSVLWALTLLGVAMSWALARWVDPIDASRPTRAVSVAVVAAAVMSASAWTGAAVSLRFAPTRVVKEWSEAEVRRLERLTPDEVASLRTVPLRSTDSFPSACELVDHDPPPAPNSCGHSDNHYALRCPIGEFKVTTYGRSCMGNTWNSSFINGHGWTCASSIIPNYDMPSSEPLYDLSQRVSLRMSPDGRVAEYSCVLEHCWTTIPSTVEHHRASWSDGRVACPPRRTFLPTPPPLYLTRAVAPRREVGELYPLRWRDETARLGLLSTLLGLLAVLLARRSVESLHAAPASPQNLGVPFRAKESPVDDRRGPLGRAHARRLLAVLVVYVAVNVAIIRVISQ